MTFIMEKSFSPHVHCDILHPPCRLTFKSSNRIMSPLVHRIYIATLTTIVVLTAAFLFIKGWSYYSMPIEERFYHPDHEQFKPSGIYGHGLGIIGTLLILIGVFGYQAKKKYRALARLGRLKYWLEFHIFLCSLGPVMILFHTAFKFGGLVSISFWSMIAVVASGVIGRFIYIQIPRSIEGRALSLQEVQAMKGNLEDVLQNTYRLDENSRQTILQSVTVQTQANNAGSWLGQYFQDKKTIGTVRQVLWQNQLSRPDIQHVTKLVKHEITLNHRISRLQLMQQLFKYWHVAHLPFALVMLVIMVIHVAITLAMGYRWIF